MHLLLLLLEYLLLPLKLVLTSLELCKVGSCLLCLASLVLLHPLKYGPRRPGYNLYQSKFPLFFIQDI